MEPKLDMVVLLNYYRYFEMQEVFLYLLSRFRQFYFNIDLVNAGLSLYQPGDTLFLSLFLEIKSHYPFYTLYCFMHFQDSQIFF